MLKLPRELGPYGFAFNATGQTAGVGSGVQLRVFVLPIFAGKLVMISGAIPDFGLAPCWLVVNGQRCICCKCAWRNNLDRTKCLHRAGCRSSALLQLTLRFRLWTWHSADTFSMCTTAQRSPDSRSSLAAHLHDRLRIRNCGKRCGSSLILDHPEIIRAQVVYSTCSPIPLFFSKLAPAFEKGSHPRKSVSLVRLLRGRCPVRFSIARVFIGLRPLIERKARSAEDFCKARIASRPVHQWIVSQETRIERQGDCVIIDCFEHIFKKSIEISQSLD